MRKLKIAAAQLGPLQRADSRSVAKCGHEDELIVCDADIDLAAELKRTLFNFAAHRRPEHYRRIVERTGAEITPANDA